MVLIENLLDLKHESGGLLVWPPGRVTFGALVGVFTPRREILQSAQAEPRRNVSPAILALARVLKCGFASGLYVLEEPNLTAQLLVGLRGCRSPGNYDRLSVCAAQHLRDVVEGYSLRYPPTALQFGSVRARDQEPARRRNAVMRTLLSRFRVDDTRGSCRAKNRLPCIGTEASASRRPVRFHGPGVKLV